MNIIRYRVQFFYVIFSELSIHVYKNLYIKT